MTSTDTQYTKINILAATEGDELLQAGEWRAIASVTPMSRGRVGVKFANGGTTVQPIHHLDGAVRRPVVEPKPVAVRKTVDAAELETGDILLSGEAVSRDLAGWQVADIRPHTFEGEVDHYHVTTEDRQGSPISWTCLPDDRFEIERTIEPSEPVEVERDDDGQLVNHAWRDDSTGLLSGPFPPVIEAWELVVEAAIETEGEDAAYGERKPSMVNVRRQLAMMVVGERRAKEVAAELAEQFKAERDAARQQLAKVTAQRDAARAAVDRTNESRVMWREEYKKTLALLGNRDQRIQATERALDRLAATIATDTIERGGAHALDVAARLVSQLHTVSDILREGE